MNREEELLARIAQLEARLAFVEARLSYWPYPNITPFYPQPPWRITCLAETKGKQ